MDKHAKTLVVTGSGYDPWKDFGLTLWQAQNGETPYDFIIYEAWRLRGQNAKALTGSDLQPVQCVGQIKAAAWWVRTPAQLVSQEPAIKPVIDKQMAALGAPSYLPRSQVEHDRDALRHLWHFAVNRYGVRP